MPYIRANLVRAEASPAGVLAPHPAVVACAAKVIVTVMAVAIVEKDSEDMPL